MNISGKENGTYTVDDLLALPDDIYAELIDGFLIFNETPTVTHQGIISELCYYIKDYINGAPDFVVEVVSPSSRSRDYIVKLNKYYYAAYTFNDQIPVGVFDDLIIDFREIDI